MSPQPGWFRIFLVGETAILGIAVFLCGWFELHPFEGGMPDWRDWVGGLVATVPMLCFLVWIRTRRTGAFGELNQLFAEKIAPIFQDWTWLQCLGISLIAGVGEELLFRTVVQGGLEGVLGPVGALLFSALLFALLHWLCPAYGWVAGLFGLWMGVVWWLSGQILVPCLAHAIYDLVALRWMRVDSDESGIGA